MTILKQDKKVSPVAKKTMTQQAKRFDNHSDTGKELVAKLTHPETKDLKPSHAFLISMTFQNYGLTPDKWRSAVNRVKAKLGSFVLEQANGAPSGGIYVLTF